MNTLNVDVEVLVLQFEGNHQERNGKISEFNQFSKAEIAESGSHPKNKFHQFQLRVDNLLVQKIEGKGIDKAERILEDLLLEDVAIDVKGVMAIVIGDEGVDQGIFIDQNY